MKLDTASWFSELLFLSLELQRSASEMAGQCRHAWASMFNRRQRLCESIAPFDGLVELTMALKCGRQANGARNKALVDPLVSVLMHSCISHVRPSSRTRLVLRAVVIRQLSNVQFSHAADLLVAQTSPPVVYNQQSIVTQCNDCRKEFSITAQCQPLEILLL